jgi:hypothetical protein
VTAGPAEQYGLAVPTTPVPVRACARLQLPAACTDPGDTHYRHRSVQARAHSRRRDFLLGRAGFVAQISFAVRTVEVAVRSERQPLEPLRQLAITEARENSHSALSLPPEAAVQRNGHVGNCCAWPRVIPARSRRRMSISSRLLSEAEGTSSRVVIAAFQRLRWSSVQTGS